jgi:hypothetical protein
MPSHTLSASPLGRFARAAARLLFDDSESDRKETISEDSVEHTELEAVQQPQPLWKSRRSFLAGGLAGLGLTGVFTDRARAEEPIGPNDGSSDWYLKVFDRLVDRTTFGATRADFAIARTMGHDAYLEYQLNPEKIDDTKCDQRLRYLRALNDDAYTTLYKYYYGQDYSAYEDFQNGMLIRAIYSKRQLLERVVEMWSDHFNTWLFKDPLPGLKPVEYREVIRKHAMGKFQDLLMATAKSPAMLAYLDNQFSYVGNTNQNYPRELLELHTLGPDNYTQRDIEEIARCFTGWTVQYDVNNENFGKFLFYPDWHDNGSKRVLGYTIAGGGGIRDGETVIRLLCTASKLKPLTAKFVAKRIAKHFVSHDPPQQVIDAIANEFLRTNGDIRSMLRVALSQNSLALSTPKLKRPFHAFVHAIRSLGGSVTNRYGFYALRYFLDAAGHHPFYWAPPDGYPDSLDYWSGYILSRWKWASYLMQNTYEIPLNLTEFNKVSEEQYPQLIDDMLFIGRMPPADRAQVEQYLTDLPVDVTRLREAIGLAISSPGFQWH